MHAHTITCTGGVRRITEIAQRVKQVRVLVMEFEQIESLPEEGALEYKGLSSTWFGFELCDEVYSGRQGQG